ncbi:hypothetical protein QWY90_03815 [Flavobacterium paronense]|uniref:Class A beta-lactamase n=1 Tax=Flavobacterium paronense TaxID=1392775 RepID=A0ABV5GHN9_9FLAO|nr:hypothetical protein [Flavobacterium paronense]MDN3676431.1 hypothetical protein [Flavobacterium paronense]
MKKIIFILIAFLVTKANAQILVKINDKLITANQTISADAIKKMEVSLAKPVLLKPNSQGKARLYVELLGTDDKVIEGYTVEKEGYNEYDQLLKNTKNSYVVYQEGGENKTFRFTLNAPPTLKAVLQQAGTNPINKLVKVKVSLMFSDKTVDAFGEVHYGYRYDLVPVFQFNIKNESTDGSIALLEIGSTFTSAIATQVKYVSQEKYKGFFYDEVNPLFTSKDVVKCYFEEGKYYVTLIFNTIDVKNKTQDDYLTDLKNSLETFLQSISNQCNKNISRDLPPVKFSDWDKVMPCSVNDKIVIPSLDGKKNKSYLSEAILKPAELGQLKGLKFNSIVLKPNCGFSSGETWGSANVYFLKHPKNNKQILMVFAIKQDKTETIENAKIAEDRIATFLSAQKF